MSPCADNMKVFFVALEEKPDEILSKNGVSFIPTLELKVFYLRIFARPADLKKLKIESMVIKAIRLIRICWSAI